MVLTNREVLADLFIGVQPRVPSESPGGSASSMAIRASALRAAATVVAVSGDKLFNHLAILLISRKRSNFIIEWPYMRLYRFIKMCMR